MDSVRAMCSMLVWDLMLVNVFSRVGLVSFLVSFCLGLCVLDTL